MRTRDKLAGEIRKVAAQASPANAAKYEDFAKRAETGEFDDYADTYVCPITQLYSEMMAAGFTKFAARVASGEFDATREESDEWARSPSGQDAAKRLSPEMREFLGLELINQVGEGIRKARERRDMFDISAITRGDVVEFVHITRKGKKWLDENVPAKHSGSLTVAASMAATIIELAVHDGMGVNLETA